MSSELNLFLVFLGALSILVALGCLLAIGGWLRNLNDRRHEVTDPSGRIWLTRLHWGHPGAGIGVARRLFPAKRMSASTDEELAGATTVGAEPRSPQPLVEPSSLASSEGTKKRRRRRFEWLDGLDVFDEGFVIVVGLLALVGLVAAAIIVLLLAIELILVVVLAAVFGILRSLFGHPWIIETTDPDGRSTFATVRRLREAVATHQHIRDCIEVGANPGDPLS